MFFIGKSGTPLEIINEPVEASQFIQTINTALEKHGIKGLENSSETSSNVICENGVCQRVTPMEASTSAAEVEGSVSRVLTAEEKVEHAKELVEKRREAKQQEEEQVGCYYRYSCLYVACKICSVGLQFWRLKLCLQAAESSRRALLKVCVSL